MPSEVLKGYAAIITAHDGHQFIAAVENGQLPGQRGFFTRKRDADQAVAHLRNDVGLSVRAAKTTITMKWEKPS